MLLPLHLDCSSSDVQQAIVEVADVGLGACLPGDFVLHRGGARSENCCYCSVPVFGVNGIGMHLGLVGVAAEVGCVGRSCFVDFVVFFL